MDYYEVLGVPRDALVDVGVPADPEAEAGRVADPRAQLRPVLDHAEGHLRLEVEEIVDVTRDDDVEDRPAPAEAAAPPPSGGPSSGGIDPYAGVDAWGGR